MRLPFCPELTDIHTRFRLRVGATGGINPDKAPHLPEYHALREAVRVLSRAP